MSRCLRRPADFIGRYGGDELVAVLPNTDLAGATYVAECIRAAVEVLAIPHHGSACADVVTISAGITSARVAADFAPDDIIQTADAALRHAKASGRNQICAACDLELGTEALVIGRAATSRAPRATSAPSNDQGAAAP
jgi:diguanylate cyclase (GGDEF)-like protein